MTGVFFEVFFLTTKPRFDVKRTYCVNARLGAEDTSLSENLHKCFYLGTSSRVCVFA